MKILYTLPDLHFGGSGNLLLQNIANLSKDNEIFVIYFGENEKMLSNFQNKELPIKRIPYSGKIDFFSAVMSLRKFIIEYEIDVIHTNLFLDKFLVSLASLGLNTRKVATIHSAAIPEQNANLKGYLQNKLMNFFLRNSFDKVVVVSNAAKEIHKEYRQLKDDQIEIIINGIESLNKKNIDDPLFPKDKTVMGTACRFDKVKGLERLIVVFAGLLKLNSDLRLLLIGDGRKRNDIEKLIEELDLQEYILITGFSEAVENYLNQLTFYVNSSFSEAMPISVIEALSIGLPVIASKVGGLPELIQDDQNGILINFNDEAAAVGEINSFLKRNNDEFSYSRLSRNARSSFEEKFSSEVYVNKLLTLYKSLLKT